MELDFREQGGAADVAADANQSWTPQINVGAAVLITEDYVGDLGVRLALYRRLSGLESQADIDAFAAEMIDRFGPRPGSVEHLLSVMTIKQLCRAAGVAKVDAGDQGSHSGHQPGFGPNQLCGESPNSSGE